jgi:hypothetical protein
MELDRNPCYKYRNKTKQEKKLLDVVAQAYKPLLQNLRQKTESSRPAWATWQDLLSKTQNQSQALVSIILATQEAEIRRITV